MIFAKISNCAINNSTTVDGQLLSISHIMLSPFSVRKGAVETALVAKLTVMSGLERMTSWKTTPAAATVPKGVVVDTKLTSDLEEDQTDSNTN